jgi:hypothetical protein
MFSFQSKEGGRAVTSVVVIVLDFNRNFSLLDLS